MFPPHFGLGISFSVIEKPLCLVFLAAAVVLADVLGPILGLEERLEPGLIFATCPGHFRCSVTQHDLHDVVEPLSALQLLTQNNLIGSTRSPHFPHITPSLLFPNPRETDAIKQVPASKRLLAWRGSSRVADTHHPAQLWRNPAGPCLLSLQLYAGKEPTQVSLVMQILHQFASSTVLTHGGCLLV